MNKIPKHYTPEKIEFYEGFEFERRGLGDLWEKDVWKFHQFSEGRFNANLTYANSIRVKHLDREDIENFGFTYSDMIDVDRLLFFKDVETYKGLESCGLLYVPQTNWVLLYTHLKQVDGVLQGGYTIELPENKITVAGGTRFCGEIKNKSEFKRILKQIGVI
jgi:hypothetical protein